MYIDPENLDREATHRILTSVVVPRPIGWVSTRSADGEDNLAPFSYYNAVSTYPPVVMFSPRTRGGSIPTAASTPSRTSAPASRAFPASSSA